MKIVLWFLLISIVFGLGVVLLDYQTTNANAYACQVLPADECALFQQGRFKELSNLQMEKRYGQSNF